MMRVRMLFLAVLYIVLGLGFCCGVANADRLPVRVFFGITDLAMATGVYVDKNQVYVPLEILSRLGLDHSITSDGKKAFILLPSGGSKDIESINIDGRNLLSLDKLSSILDIEYITNLERRTVTVLAKLKSVEFVENILRINTSIPVAYSVLEMQDKIIVDLSATKLDADAKEVFIGTSVVEKARLGQFEQTKSRVVLDLKKPAGHKQLSEPFASRIKLEVSDKLPRTSSAKPASETIRNFTIEDVAITAVDERSFSVRIKTSEKGSVAVVPGNKPSSYVIRLNGGTLSETTNRPETKHDLLQEITLVQNSISPANASINVDLKRMLTHNINVTDNVISVTFMMPHRAGGKLADKVIVIDPGHGGRDSGAIQGSVREKDLNMQISREVAEMLQKHGATVILTRNGDATIDKLSDRSAVAVNNNADFFISIHCNRNVRPNSASGIETYYHMDDPSGRLFAQLVHDSVVAHSKMNDRKFRSDRVLYANGLGVLRHLRARNIPAILIECGYMNHTNDLALLQNSSHQKKLAQGIVSGLKKYIEGTN
ncbi:MAG: N-acetylmuramoyl-L-alanine amidase [Armatimonadota bacterium]